MATMIGSEENDCIVGQIEALECIHHPPESFVKPLDHAPVPRKVLLRCAAQGRQVGRRPSALVALTVAVRRGIGVEPILMVRLEERQEQEEWTALVFVNEADTRIRHRVDAIPREVNGLIIVVPQARPVRFGGELEGVGPQPGFVAAPLFRRHGVGSGKMPLPDVARVIPGIPEGAGERRDVGRKRDTVPEAAGPGRVETGLQRCTRRTTDRLARKRIGDPGSSQREPVKIGHQIERVSGQSRAVPPLLIGEEDDDIRPTGLVGVRCCHEL